MGTSIRSRAFGTNGMPAGTALVLPVMGAAGDQGASAVAAADGRYVVAWSTMGGGVSARFVSGAGAAVANREQPQTVNDFVVAASGNAPSAIAMGTTIASWLIGYDDGNDVYVRRYPR
jgi:glycerol kinase